MTVARSGGSYSANTGPFTISGIIGLGSINYVGCVLTTDIDRHILERMVGIASGSYRDSIVRRAKKHHAPYTGILNRHSRNPTIKSAILIIVMLLCAGAASAQQQTQSASTATSSVTSESGPIGPTGPVPGASVNSVTQESYYQNNVYYGGGSPYFDVKAFCASGSQQQTTGTLTDGGTKLTVASAIDFLACPFPAPAGAPAGEGVTIYHAGLAPTISTPTGVSVTVNGTPGTTQYCYRVSAIDYAGGQTPATSQVCTSTGPATPTGQTPTGNNMKVTWNTSGTFLENAYVVYKTKNGANNGVATVWDTPTNASETMSLIDSNVETGTAIGSAPDYANGAGNPPSSALNDWCQTTISTGAGTTILVLSPACPNAASGATVKHDDTPAIQAATTAAAVSGGTVYFPADSATRGAAAYNVGTIVFPDAQTYPRGWITWQIDGQLNLTNQQILTTPTTVGHEMSRIRFIGGLGGPDAGQFETTSGGTINPGYVSPAFHMVYANSTSLSPIEFTRLRIHGYGSDGILIDGGNSPGPVISGMHIITSGTPIKAGYTGPAIAAGSFIMHITDSTFQSAYVGNTDSAADPTQGRSMAISYGQGLFESIIVVGHGIYGGLIGTDKWSLLLSENVSDPSLFLLASDPIVPRYPPFTGQNTLENAQNDDSPGNGVTSNLYAVKVIGRNTQPVNSIIFHNVYAGTLGLVGGAQKVVSCTIVGDTVTLPAGAGCLFQIQINGNISGLGPANEFNAPANFLTGLQNLYSLSLGPPTSGHSVLGMQASTGGFSGDYLDILDPSSTLTSQTKNLFFDSLYNISTIGGITSVATTVSGLPSASANLGMRRTVSDSTTIAAPGQACVGGGSVTAQAFSDGSVWHCSY